MMMNITVNKWLGSLNSYIIIFWVLLTAININKAYHIDDTFHLEAAECIRQHPFKPMSGCINWHDSPSPMYEYNQPPLFFYLILLFQFFEAGNEISMHLLLSVFTFLSLLYFSKLALFLNVKYPKTILTIFAFCPAFVVNQNLMTDVPILAISLGIMYYLLKGLSQESMRDYLISAILLSLGLLIKYSLLPVMLVMLLSIILSKNYKNVIVLIIPLTVLLLWSIWNLFEFGSVHLFTRPKSEFQIDKLWSFMGTLGAVSTFSVIYIYYLLPKRITLFFIILIFSLFLFCLPLVYFGFIEEVKFNNLLNCLFIANGLVLMTFILKEAIDSFTKEKGNYIKTPYFTLAIYILGVSAFITLFAPFNATRHVLLLIPFILLFSHKQFEATSGIINNLVITFTIILGLLLGVSDWIYANFYRENVKKIKIADKKVWSIGHWGWQWYSKKADMKVYSLEDELNVRKGDIIVYPKDISRQNLNSDIELDTINFITEPPNFFTFFSGKDFASMYNSYSTTPAWSLSNRPIDTIFVCKVKKEIGVEEIINRIKSDENRLKALQKKALEKKMSLDSILVLVAKWVITHKRNE
jgi:hypothetical protein